MASATLDDLNRNKLLAALPREEMEGFAGDFELIPEVPLRQLVYEAGQPVDHVWFPLSSVFSLLAVMGDGRSVEVATIGNEGFVGLPVFLQGRYTSGQMAFCQVPGGAVRIASTRFNDLVSGSDPLQALLHRYTLALLTQIGQSSACNRLHTLVQRCARWILMTHDRAGRDEFTLTQEFLAQMLGVRRAGVNEAMQELQERGLVTYARGQIAVTDRGGLEATACECYALIRDEHERLAEPGGDGRVPSA
jgi:CRP-like cAMP-binding protein